jgi:hypothetical protein
MDGLWVCDRLQKVIREREQFIASSLMSNALADMAQYRNLMGEVTALGIVGQEIQEILKKGTQDNEHGTLLTGTFGPTEGN